MDFILELSKTPRHFDSVMVVVDRFSKMAHFVTCKKNANASLMATLFFKNVVELLRVPKSIVTNKDVKFTGHFWNELWKRFKNELKVQH